MRNTTRHGPRLIRHFHRRQRNHSRQTSGDFMMFAAASSLPAPAKFTDTHYETYDYQKSVYSESSKP